MAWDPAALYLLACKSQLRCADHGFPLQAGAITGGVAAFAEGPIDFYKSQIQVQIIRSKSDPNYKREAAGTLPPYHDLPTQRHAALLLHQYPALQPPTPRLETA